MKIPFGVALLFALLGSAPPAEAAKYQIRWLGNPKLEYFEESAAMFKEAVEKGSGGEIAVDIPEFDDPAKAQSPLDVAKSVAKGDAEMGHSFTSVVGGLDRRLLGFDLPYLFRDYEHLEGVYEGPLGQELLDGLRERKLQGLAFTYSGGANIVATRERELRKPEDLRGLRVGTYGHPADRAWLQSLGAVPVELDHTPESFSRAARKGEIDAAMITWNRFERAGLKKDFRLVNLAGSTNLVSVMYINQKFLESLPEKYRTLIKDAARATARIERAETIKYNEYSRRMAKAKGVRETYSSEENALAFKKALRPVYESSYEGIVGKELIERLRKAEPGVFPTGIVDVAER